MTMRGTRIDWRECAVFENTSFPNLKIRLNGEGGEVWVSLNVEPEMIKYLSPNNLYKGDKFWVYTYHQQIQTVTLGTVVKAYEELMDKLRIACREAKIKVLKEEIKSIG